VRGCLINIHFWQLLFVILGVVIIHVFTSFLLDTKISTCFKKNFDGFIVAESGPNWSLTFFIFLS